MLFTFAASFINGLDSAGIQIAFISNAVHHLPFYDLSLGWIIPFMFGSLLGFLPIFEFMNKHNEQLETM